MTTSRRDVLVAGYCPACGRESLTVDDDGFLGCNRRGCPRPDAAHEILDDPETEHIVQLASLEFTVRHPLRERLDDALMSCDLHRWITRRDGPPYEPRRYRVSADGTGGWSWERIDG
jgi:hypothetical protein